MGDSNSRRIAPYFQKLNTWDIAENTYVIKDIENIRSEKTYDAVVVLLGTNNIKTGKDGRSEAERLLSSVEKVEFARNKFVVELPPIKRTGKESERRIFNCTLHQKSKDKNIEVIRMTSEIEESPIDRALQDDLHLTNKNASLMAQQIETQVERTIKKERDNKERRSHQNERKESAAEARVNYDWKKYEGKKHIPCHFHQQGRCYRGEKCLYGHDLESNSRGRERDEARERPNREENRERNNRERSRERRDSRRSRERRTSSQSGGERRRTDRDRSPSRDRRTVIDIRSVRKASNE